MQHGLSIHPRLFHQGHRAGVTWPALGLDPLLASTLTLGALVHGGRWAGELRCCSMQSLTAVWSALAPAPVPAPAPPAPPKKTLVSEADNPKASLAPLGQAHFKWQLSLDCKSP